MKWYVIKTKPSMEKLAIQQLTQQDFLIYQPRMKLRRKGVWVFVPLFPSYLFVKLDIARDRWQAINNTRGCKYVMCMDPERPSPLPRGFIEKIMEDEQNGKFIKVDEKTIYKVGDKVKLTSGPFSGHMGICEISTGKRVSILLDLLGRKVMVSSDHKSVIPAS
jgi:transcription elongation factor/antiterminator RfaH